MTLLDFPGHVACTVFTGGCDMRCPFCHNYELVDGSAPPIMEEEELFAFLEKRRGLLDGVAFTGGEPCLQKNLPDLMKRVKQMGYSIKLDTNGNHPDMLRRMMEEGLLDYVAMDIKNSPDKYALTAGLRQIDMGPIRESVKMLMEGPVNYEFRTTCVAQFHEEEDFVKIGEWLEGAKAYFLQSFTDRDSVPFGNLTAPTREEIYTFCRTVQRFIPNTHVRGVD